MTNIQTKSILSILFLSQLSTLAVAAPIGGRFCEAALRLKHKANSVAEKATTIAQTVGGEINNKVQKTTEVLNATANKVQANSISLQDFHDLKARIKSKALAQSDELRKKVTQKLEEAEVLIKKFNLEPTDLEKQLVGRLEGYQGQGNYEEFHPWLFDLVRHIDNPFTVGHELHSIAKKANKSTQEITEKLLDIFILSKDSGTLIKALNEWIQSESQALLVYSGLVQSRSPLVAPTLNDLLINNIYFSEGLPFDASSDGSRPRLISFSFEKESQSKVIRLFYRVGHFTEDEWFALDDETAIKLLEKYSMVPNKEVLSKIILPTSLKPDSWGPYTTDGSATFQLENRGSEITHKLYEIDPFRLEKQMEETANLFEETHSFHVHVVTELPSNYRHFKEFIHWYKYVSDYLYLLGLEEGLHNTALTQIPIMPEDAEATDAFLGRLQNKLGLEAKTLPTRLDQLGDRNAKKYGIGLRSGAVYGKQDDPHYVKTALELRDATRNLKTWKSYIRRVATALATRTWESYAEHSTVSLLRIGHQEPKQNQMLLDLVGAEHFQQMTTSDPQVLLPLMDFENHYYFNFSGREISRPDKTKANAIKAAREKYLLEIKDLSRQMQEYADKGEQIEPEIIQHIVRMALTHWARDCHISELFQGALQLRQ